MKKLTMILAGLITAVLLQGCGTSGAMPGSVSGSTTDVASSGTDQAPTITYMGFAVVQQDGGYSAKIVVFFSEDMDPATIVPSNFLVKDAQGHAVPGTMQYIGVTAVYTPDQRFEAHSNYSVTVETGVRSLSGVPLATPKTWDFMTPDPSELTGVVVAVSSVAPITYATDVPLNSGVNVTFNKLMDPTTINTSTVTVLDPAGNLLAGQVHYSGVTASFVPNQYFVPNTTYRVIVSNGVKSLSGVNMDTSYHSEFTTGYSIQAAAPQVVMTAPLAGDTGVSIGGTIVADFDQTMDTQSINTSTFQVHDATGAAVAGSVTYTGETAVFTPDSPLLPQTTYTATVSTGATSSGGVAMSQPYSWSFTTAAFSQVDAPTVLFSSPGPYDVGVSTSTSIDVAFSEAMDPTTFTTANVTVTDPSGNAVSGSVSYLNDVLIFTPASPLAAGVTYTVNLSSGIKSQQGGSLAPYSWSFTTMGTF